MNAHPNSIAFSGRDFNAAALRARPPLALQDVTLHPLRTPAEIAEIVFLRDEIDLSVHAAAGVQFEALEKKETSAASSAGSSSGASGSARSASSPWVTS